MHLFAGPFLPPRPNHDITLSSMRSRTNLISSALISRRLALFKKFMDVVLPDETSQDAAVPKRLLEGEGTALPEPKRAKLDEETPDISLDKRPSGTSDAKQKSQKGKQNEKNKGRRRGTRVQVEDDPNRPKTPRLPKKQCAILIGFSGTGYAGMQM